MRLGTKKRGRGRPVSFDRQDVLDRLQAYIWDHGLSSSSLDQLAQAAGLNRPSLARSFGDKNDIYAETARVYLSQMARATASALDKEPLETGLMSAFASSLEKFYLQDARGCYVLCLAPSEAKRVRIAGVVLNEALEAVRAAFRTRLEREARADPRMIDVSVEILTGAQQSVALSARAGGSREALMRIAECATAAVSELLNNNASSSHSGRRL